MSEKTARTARRRATTDDDGKVRKMTAREIEEEVLKSLDTRSGQRIAQRWLAALEMADDEEMDLDVFEVHDRTSGDDIAVVERFYPSGVKARTILTANDPEDPEKLKTYKQRRAELREVKLSIHALAKDRGFLHDLEKAVAAKAKGAE